MKYYFSLHKNENSQHFLILVMFKFGRLQSVKDTQEPMTFGIIDVKTDATYLKIYQKQLLQRIWSTVMMLYGVIFGAWPPLITTEIIWENYNLNILCNLI